MKTVERFAECLGRNGAKLELKPVKKRRKTAKAIAHVAAVTLAKSRHRKKKAAPKKRPAKKSPKRRR